MPSVTDDGGTIRIVNGSDVVHVSKAKATVQVIESDVRIQWEADYFIQAPYTEYTAPTGANSNAVADAIAAFLDTGI